MNLIKGIVFQFTDHLGNVRLSYSDILKDGVINPSTDIIEESNYYPFGLKHLGYNDNIIGGNDVAQAWKFGGKEYNQELGLDWYDVTARNYDPALGRWMNIDPLAELMRRHSPYNFAFDNPIFFIDADGMTPTPSAVSAAQSGNFDSIGVSISFSSNTDPNSLAKGTTIIDAGGGGTVLSSGSNSDGGNPAHSQQSNTNNPSKPNDYFDKDTGKFLGKGGTDDIRFISSDDWDQGNLENFSTYASNENVEAAVYEYYATTNNLAPENATGCQFCAGLSDGWSTSNYDGVLAFNFSRNSIGLDVLKAQDAINVLVHEIGDGGHGGDFIRGTVKKSGIDANWEMRATNSQVRHSSWHNTSTTLKTIIYQYYGKFMNSSNQIKYFGNYGVKLGK